ncbi:MAG: GDSL-type esterase/lipase family protein [Bryobacteraceae bacterium]|nr:GDSL-type esterase/lipase family protein [Bryobacteraceae bacterium]
MAALVSMAALEPLSNIQAEPAVVRRAPARRKSVPPPVDAEARARAVDQVAQFLSEGAEIYIENAGALVPFFEQLYRYEQGENPSVHVLHYGDSHTAADDWPGLLRTGLQARFGDGGSGFSLAGRPWNSYRRLDVRSWSSGGWHTDGLVGRYGNGYYGLGGVSLSTNRAQEWVSLEANCETIEIFYLRQPGGGSFSFSHNGAYVDTISTDGPLGPGYYSFKVPAGVHRFDVSTRDRAPVRLHGWVAETARGLTYETLGINGAQASIAFRWNEDLLAGHIAKRNPALVMFAYGTNEADSPDWTKESYREMFATLLNRFRKAAPTATLLVLGPPDRMLRRGRSWISHDRLDMIIEAQREAALGTGCAFLDLRAKMGGKGSMQHWVLAGLGQYDRVHFTSPGYRLLGQTMFEELTRHYGTFVKVRERLVSLNPGREPNGQASENN